MKPRGNAKVEEQTRKSTKSVADLTVVAETLTEAEIQGDEEQPINDTKGSILSPQFRFQDNNNRAFCSRE